MLETLYLLLINKEPDISSYQCTQSQLKKASEVFKPCYDEKHFQMCYEASIREYCTLKVKK